MVIRQVTSRSLSSLAFALRGCVGTDSLLCRGLLAQTLPLLPQHSYQCLQLPIIGLAGGLELHGFSRVARGFAASSPDLDQAATSKLASAASILQQASVLKFREQLEEESKSAAQISFKELLAKCQSSGAASTVEEAQRICDGLTTAGVVLRFQDIVYLKPQEVVDNIIQVLPPAGKEELESQLQALETELEEMRARKQQIDTRAHRRALALQWFGLSVLVLQFGLFIRLTFWELSWDVMEPVAYFVSLWTGILAYTYFMITQQDFAYQSWKSRLLGKYQEDGYRRKGFDLPKFQQLLHDVERYRKYARAIKP